MSTFQKLESTFVKPAVAGAISAGISCYQFPSQTVSLFGSNVPVWAVMGLSTAAATLAGEVAGNYVLPHIPNVGSATLQNVLQTGLNPALAAGANVLALQQLAPTQYASTGLAMSLAIGAGSYIAADYINRRLIGNNM
jgi:hypothetical protein